MSSWRIAIAVLGMVSFLLIGANVTAAERQRALLGTVSGAPQSTVKLVGGLRPGDQARFTVRQFPVRCESAGGPVSATADLARVRVRIDEGGRIRGSRADREANTLRRFVAVTGRLIRGRAQGRLVVSENPIDPSGPDTEPECFTRRETRWKAARSSD